MRPVQISVGLRGDVKMFQAVFREVPRTFKTFLVISGDVLRYSRKFKEIFRRTFAVVLGDFWGTLEDVYGDCRMFSRRFRNDSGVLRRV